MDYLFFAIYVLIFLTINMYFCFSVKYFSIKYKKVEIKKKRRICKFKFCLSLLLFYLFLIATTSCIVINENCTMIIIITLNFLVCSLIDKSEVSKLNNEVDE